MRWLVNASKLDRQMENLSSLRHEQDALKVGRHKLVEVAFGALRLR
jgi:hypothetical protein